MNLSNTYSYYMIQGLQPGTEYNVTINPVFGDVEGPVVSRKATTGEYPVTGVGASSRGHGWWVKLCRQHRAGVICSHQPACRLLQKTL